MNRRSLLKSLGAAAGFTALGAGGAALFLHQEKFGALPDEEEIRRFAASPHFRDGRFINLVPTPMSTGEGGTIRLWADFLLSKKTGTVPASPLPVSQINPASLPADRDTLQWYGLSSFFLRLHGLNILADPVFSLHASPVSFTTGAFPGTAVVQASDMPAIDWLFLSHDHWDHLDFPTISALRPKIRNVACGLGTGAHLRLWGFDRARIHELDWHQSLDAGNGVSLTFLPGRHFSGRGLTRDKSLWGGMLLRSPDYSFLFSGDSGYGPHFRETGRQYGPVDLALLDCGQYDKNWHYVHMFPEEACQAAEELGARHFMPVHIGKFSIAYHTWYDPFRRALKASEGRAYQLLTPIIGQAVPLSKHIAPFPAWWEPLVKDGAENGPERQKRQS